MMKNDVKLVRQFFFYIYFNKGAYFKHLSAPSLKIEPQIHLQIKLTGIQFEDSENINRYSIFVFF